MAKGLYDLYDASLPLNSYLRIREA